MQKRGEASTIANNNLGDMILARYPRTNLRAIELGLDNVLAASLTIPTTHLGMVRVAPLSDGTSRSLLRPFFRVHVSIKTPSLRKFAMPSRTRRRLCGRLDRHREFRLPVRRRTHPGGKLSIYTGYGRKPDMKILSQPALD